MEVIGRNTMQMSIPTRRLWQEWPVIWHDHFLWSQRNNRVLWIMEWWILFSHFEWSDLQQLQCSSSSLADSIFWIVRPLAVVSQTAMNHDLPSLWKSETMWAWYHWITSLVARNGSEMTYRWLAASEQWTVPKCPVFVLWYSFPRVKQSTSLQSIQMEG